MPWQGGCSHGVVGANWRAGPHQQWAAFQRIRDEAHRFAVKLHKKQRKKRLISSVLDNIKGVGQVTRNKLLNHFGSIENIKKASIEDLTQIIGKKLAEIIVDELNKQ